MRIYRGGRRQSYDDEAKILLFRAGAVVRDLQRLTKAWRANGYLASNPAIVTDILKIAAAHSQPLELEAAVGRIRSGKQYDAGRPIWLRRWARSQLPEADDEQIADALTEPPRDYTPDDIAALLGVTLDMRQKLKLWSFGACDATRQERLDRAKQDKNCKDREQKARRRRQLGKQTRAQYEANSLNRTQPWVALGISRRTYERQRKNGAASSVASCSRVGCRDVSQVVRDS